MDTKQIIINHIMENSVKNNITLYTDDIHWETDGILRFIGDGTSSIQLQVQQFKPCYQVVVLSPAFSNKEDNYFPFRSLDDAFTCLKSLQKYHSNIIETTQYF